VIESNYKTFKEAFLLINTLNKVKFKFRKLSLKIITILSPFVMEILVLRTMFKFQLLNYFLFVIIFTSIYSNTKAQTNNDSLENPNKFGLSILGGNNPGQASLNTTEISNKTIYQGIQSAVPQYFIKPAFIYNHNSGIRAGLSATYLFTDSINQFDNILFSIGYSKTIFKHLVIDLDYSYAHYYSSLQIASASNHNASLTLAYDNKIITPSINAYYSFGGTSDYSYTGALEHCFSFDELFTSGDNFSIPLSVNGSFGTANFLETYVIKNRARLKQRVNKKPLLPATVPVVKTKFGLNSVCVSAGFYYSIGNYSIIAIVNYIKQVNTIEGVAENTTPAINIGLSYTL
jgi:hypothetical protein